MARRGSRSSAVALSRATRTPNTKEKRFFQEAGPPVRADPAAEVARPHVDACGRPRVRMALLKGEAGVDLSRATCSSPRPRAPASRRCGARASLTRRVSSTYGPALDRSWVEGLAVEPCLKTPALLHHLHQSRHRQVTGWRRLVHSEGWGDAGSPSTKCCSPSRWPRASSAKKRSAPGTSTNM